jgi:hypothetical protein
MSLKAIVTNEGHFYEMDGPHTSTTPLLKQSGVYLISTVQANGTHKVIDVGESGDVHQRVSTHDRAPEWQPHAIDKLYVSAFYCNEQTRMVVEQQLRAFHNPPVGVR